MTQEVVVVTGGSSGASRMATPMSTPVALDGTTLALLAEEVVDLRRQVADLSSEANRSILGYGPFETSAVCLALFVMVYQLVPDPTGQQDAKDLSELSVYRQWMVAMSCLIGYVFFVMFVLAHQLAAGWRGNDIGWLLALMLAPWAPFIRTLYRTVRSARQVRRMMLDRTTRNRITAVLREYLLLGHASLSTAGAAHSLGFVNHAPIMPFIPNDLVEYAREHLPRETDHPRDERRFLLLSRHTARDSPSLDDLSLP